MVSISGVSGRNRSAVGGDERELRAAVPAGVGLGVEAAVGGIVVLGLAGGAHLEARHGGLRAVVGNAAGDGVARAAVGAVEKGIAIAAVRGREQFAEAVGTGGGVCGNSRRYAAEDFAGNDAEARFAGGMRSRAPRRSRCARAAAPQSGGATRNASIECCRTFDFDGDAVGVVADEAGQMFFRSKAIDKGTKSDALHNAADSRDAAQRHFVLLLVLVEFLSDNCLASYRSQG